MSGGWLVKDGARWVRIELAAGLYSLQSSTVLELLDSGLLDETLTIDGELWLAEPMLDRLARVSRLHHHLGLELAAVEAWIARG